MPDRCHADTKRGTRCSATVVADGMCAWHTTDPAWDARRRAWSQKGGRQRSNRARIQREFGAGMGYGEIDALLSICLRGVVSGRIAPGVATAAAAVARATIDVREAGEVEGRLRLLEDRAAGGRRFGA